MRIGILTNYHLEQVGGAEEVIDRLATLWLGGGHDVRLFSAPARSKRPTRPWQPAYRHIRLGRVFSSRFGLSRYVRAMRKEHAALPLDVVLACDAYWAGHVARLFSQASGQEVRLLRRSRASGGVPYVICSHGSDVMHGSRFLTRPITKERLQLSIRDADAIACISSYMRSRTEGIAKPRGIVRLVLNGWPDEWSRRTCPRAVASPYVFAMGRVVELKGFQTLVEAFARVRAKQPHWSLVIAGEGNYLPQLFEQANKLGLQPTRELPQPGDARPIVCFPGFVHGDTKLSLIQHAPVAVSPSIRQEPMSLVLFEMLCCGVPVIGSRVGGTPDIVRPGLNGELFEASDIAALATVLDRLLGNAAARDRLASQARSSVEPYRWSQVADGYLQLFKEAVAARRKMLASPVAA